MQLEYGILRWMGAIDEKTLVVTTIHDCQVRFAAAAIGGMCRAQRFRSEFCYITLQPVNHCNLKGKMCGTQVLEPGSIDPSQMLEHDVPVDIIVTPTRVIHTHTSIKKPEGILWHKLSPEKLGQIRVLQTLKARLEMEAGKALPTGARSVRARYWNLTSCHLHICACQKISCFVSWYLLHPETSE